MAETHANEVVRRLEAEGRRKESGAPAQEARPALPPPHTPDDGHDHAKAVEEAKEKAHGLAEPHHKEEKGHGGHGDDAKKRRSGLVLGAMAAGFVAAKGVEKGGGFLYKQMERFQKWGEKNAKKLGEIPLIGGFLVWALEKVGLAGGGGGDHGHAKKDDHGKKGGHGGGHGGGGHH